MSDNKALPAGLWPSPVDVLSLATALRFEDLAWAADGTLLWLEHRGASGTVLAAPPDASAQREVTGPEHNVRARVGYGGGALASGSDLLVFAECHGQLYRQPLAHGPAQAITPRHGYAAAPALAPDGELVLYVHHDGHDDCLAVGDVSGRQWPQRLVTGADFYLDPAWSPNGRHVAWVEWDHPRMPWDGSRLMLAELQRDAGRVTLQRQTRLAGDDTTSVTQPRFAPDGKSLAYLSDANGWPNLYLYDLASGSSRCLLETDAELGPPAWVQGARTFAFDTTGQSLLAVENRQGFQRLLSLSLSSGETTPLAGLERYSDLRAIAPAPQAERGALRVALIASGPQTSPRVLVWQPDGVRIVRRSTGERIASASLAAAEPVTWPAADGTTVHGILYRPHSPGRVSAEPPPAVVAIHGGPTAQATASYNPRAQFFATRGYAYLEVNYRGSSGYGRSYQQALDGRWGILDVEDALGAHDFLQRSGAADGKRVAIMGGSAGGYTVLKTLTDHPGVFAAGVSLYGVSNLFTLATDTHKFEAHYLDTLVGPLPAAADAYRERSPIFSADRIRDPLAVFQGSADRVVPPDQAEQIVTSLRQRGVPHEYHLYEGEEHGFRRPDTLQRFYSDLERFLAQHLIYR